METILVFVFKEVGLNELVDAIEADLGPNFPRLFFVKEDRASRGGGRRKVALEKFGFGRGRVGSA